MGPTIGHTTVSDYQAVDDLNDLLHTVTLNTPAGTADGDKLLAFIYSEQGGAQPNPTTGWTQLAFLGTQDTAQDARAPWNGVAGDTGFFDQYLEVWAHDVTSTPEPGTYSFTGRLSGDKPLVVLTNTHMGDQQDRFTGFTIVQNVNFEDPSQGGFSNDVFWGADPVVGHITDPATLVNRLPTQGYRTSGHITSQVSSPNSGDTTFHIDVWAYTAQVTTADEGSLSGAEFYAQLGTTDTALEAGSAFSGWDVSNVNFPAREHLIVAEGADGEDATALPPAGSSTVTAFFADNAYNPVVSPVDPYVMGIGLRVYPMFSAPLELPPPDGGYLEIKARKVDPGVPPYRLTNRMLGRDDGSPR